MKRIAVIIPNLNLAQDTISTVRDLEGQKLPKGYVIDFIVVDNGSSDGSVSYLRRDLPGAEIIDLSQNLGVTGGYNAGLKYALEKDYNYVLVANNDLVIKQQICLLRLFQILDTDSEAGVVGPLIYFAPEFVFHKERYKSGEIDKVIWYAGGVIDRKNVLMTHRGVDEVDHGQYRDVQEVDFVTGTFMLFKAEVLRKVGLFNDDYFAYLEDVEMSERVRRAGYKLLFAPQAKIYHKVSQTAGGIGGNWNDYYITRNRLLFGMKFLSGRTKFALGREAIKLLFRGRKYQKEAVKDYFLGRLGRKDDLPK